MKKLFVLFAFLGFVSFSATAQSCNPAACKKAHKTTAVDAKTDVNAAAVKLASLDKTIETKTCATSGKVSFTRKNVCATSGKVSFTDVEYCSKSAKFVNVSPSAKASCSAAKGASAKQVSVEAAPKKACCAKGTSKEECAKMKAASAKQVSNGAAPKKACCAKGSASSCSKSKASAKAETTTNGNVKLISNKN